MRGKGLGPSFEDLTRCDQVEENVSKEGRQVAQEIKEIPGVTEDK